MKRLLLLSAALLLANHLAEPADAEPAGAGAPRPNILYFYVDDMGWGAIGPNGQAQRRAEGKAYVRTPNLDRLAAQGVNFVRGYGCHVCSPARSSQQTGFHQGHTFADRNDPNNAKKAIRADDVALGDALADAGYTTGYWGKWGYGGSKELVNPVIQNVQTLPTAHGYQFVLAELHHVRAHTFFQPTLWHAPARPGAKGGLELVPNSMQGFRDSNRYPNTPALQAHGDYPGIAYCDDSYAMAALNFVREQGQAYRRSGQPFFGLLAVQIPHAPFKEITTLPEWDQAYGDDPHFADLADQTRQWAAMVTRIDAHIGNILAALEDPNNDGDTSDSIASNTLVIFQSDNGGPSGKNNTELDANGGLRGNKGSIYEGGIRVPLVVRWPAMIHADSALKAGTNSEKVVDVTDLCPTLCELAGVDAPLGVDGVSIAPTLTGSGQPRNRDFIIHEASNGQSIIRGRHKLIRFNKQPLALYDLRDDRSEQHNIADQHPALVRELEALLIGERVTEPAGFATTYHHWIGNEGDATGDADHWSDYTYENDGVAYMQDPGSPQPSWIARINNSRQQPQTLKLTEDMEVLALEIAGVEAKQTLVVGKGISLTGRNEIRLSQNAHLHVLDGTLASLRWIDIRQTASLTGHGRIEADVFNDGEVSVEGPLRIQGDYHQSDNGKLGLLLQAESSALLNVDGDANLGGELRVVEEAGDSSGKVVPLIEAKKIEGKFANPGDRVVGSQGASFRIEYSDAAVRLVRETE